MNIVVILGTSRSNNKSQTVATYILELLNKNAKYNIAFLNLAEEIFPVMRDRYSIENAPGNMTDWVSTINDANGIIIVSPEYKNGYPGSLKNFLDYLPSGVFRYKTVGIVTVSSGPYGGANCLAQLRLVSIAMGGLVIPDRFQVAWVDDFINKQGEVSEKDSKVSIKFISEFIKYCEAFSSIKN